MNSSTLHVTSHQKLGALDAKSFEIPFWLELLIDGAVSYPSV